MGRRDVIYIIILFISRFNSRLVYLESSEMEVLGFGVGIREVFRGVVGVECGR